MIARIFIFLKMVWKELLVGLGVVGIFFWFVQGVPPLRAWWETSWFLYGPSMICVVAIYIAVRVASTKIKSAREESRTLQDNLTRLTTDQQALQKQAKEDADTSQARENHLAELQCTHATTVAENQILQECAAELEARWEDPTPHDRSQFEEWLTDLPGTAGLRVGLKHFYARRWRAELADGIHDYHNRWADRRFTQPALDAAFAEFNSALEELIYWMDTHGFSEGGESFYFHKPDRMDRDDVSKRYYAEESEGQGLAQNAYDLAAEFEHVGHSLGL